MVRTKVLGDCAVCGVELLGEERAEVGGDLRGVLDVELLGQREARQRKLAVLGASRLPDLQASGTNTK
jgi:hypothetical protein